VPGSSTHGKSGGTWGIRDESRSLGIVHQTWYQTPWVASVKSGCEYFVECYKPPGFKADESDCSLRLFFYKKIGKR